MAHAWRHWRDSEPVDATHSAEAVAVAVADEAETVTLEHDASGGVRHLAYSVQCDRRILDRGAGKEQRD